jgi:putative oxidoreductase
MTTSAEPRPLLASLSGLYDYAIPLSWPLVRIAAGGILAVHGWAKVMGFANFVPVFDKMGYQPATLIVALLLVVEFVGGIAIALGLFTRLFAAAAAIEMAEITFDVYWSHGFNWTRTGYEFTLMWGLILLAIALRGGGPWSLDRAIGREL